MLQISEEKLELIEYTNQNGFSPTVCIQLLNWCNLHCAYCRSNSSSRMKDVVSYDSLEKLLTRLRSFGKWRISLTGGEPFYWKEISKLLVLLYDLDFQFSITTNAFASKQIFDTIPSYVWKKCTLYVSIDGDLETHNTFRGKNSFENAISFIEYVRPTVKKLFVNTVLFTDAKIWANSLYKTLNSLRINNWTIITPVNQGRWHKDIAVGINFKQQYEIITSIANDFTTTTFLDFASKDSIVSDVVFIDSDSSIRLPGYFVAKDDKPQAAIIEMNDNYVCEKIVSAVNDFIISEKYIL